MKLALALLPFAMLGGCAVQQAGAPVSYVAPAIGANDARAIAADVTTHLAQQLPPARTTLVLYAPGRDAAVSELSDALRSFGFGVYVASPRKGEAAAAGTALRYLVSPFDDGVIVRLQYQHREDARFYARSTDGSLIAASPFTVRETAQ